MFNKIKSVASSLGNKQQRANARAEADAEMDMAIEITKLELIKNRNIKPYIHNVADDEKYPTYIGRQALWMTEPMNEETKNTKISFLRHQKIKTNMTPEGLVIGFETTDEQQIN